MDSSECLPEPDGAKWRSFWACEADRADAWIVILSSHGMLSANDSYTWIEASIYCRGGSGFQRRRLRGKDVPPWSRMQDGIVFPLLCFRSIEGGVFGMAFVQDAPVRAPFLDAATFEGS